MATHIRGAVLHRGRTRLPARLCELLPRELCEEIDALGEGVGHIEELRLRTERASALTTDRGTVRLQTVLSRAWMDQILLGLCNGSLYAHRDTIAAGYLTLPEGIRVGICGRASVEGEKILGVYDVSALNFRFPSRLLGWGAPIVRLLRERRDGRGILIYAPPGEGKTTLLRCVAAQMASGNDARRVAVIDTRGELGFSLEGKDLSVDVLSGYPRGLGIEIATRTMNAELIVCDELGEEREAAAILSAQNSGVPFVATAHAENVSGLLRRTGIRRLHEARVFFAYVGIRRPRGGGEFIYTVTDWEAAEHGT
ncbi:MAG: hypothetical protein IJD64_01870 [Clostridia bacterium]|nr:hypothetical protein [Clostridia bacterium]